MIFLLCWRLSGVWRENISKLWMQPAVNYCWLMRSATYLNYLQSYLTIAMLNCTEIVIERHYWSNCYLKVLKQHKHPQNRHCIPCGTRKEYVYLRTWPLLEVDIAKRYCFAKKASTYKYRYILKEFQSLRGKQNFL